VLFEAAGISNDEVRRQGHNSSPMDRWVCCLCSRPGSFRKRNQSICDSGNFCSGSSILQGPFFRPAMVEYYLRSGKSCSEKKVEKGSHSICVVCSTLREIVS
jgi:hypothetical protein